VNIAAHVAAEAYDPPDDAAKDNWMANENDLVAAVEELEAEFTTQNVKDKIDATTGAGSVANTVKRARKRYLLLKRANSLTRDWLLEAVKGKPLPSYIKNTDYIQSDFGVRYFTVTWASGRP
jgi:hypothetical protein